ncbi:MAG: protocatechuate 3,4-dioxygenase subunit beta [Pseudomonadota bacterium]|nr:protocatechuate 3,4-dioxygenase subunit beta [Pseudomonadota bacterium]
MTEAVRDPASHPPAIDPEYRSTLQRGPRMAPVLLPSTLSERTGPAIVSVPTGSSDLTRNGRTNGAPLGERIIVTGRVTDDAGRPLPGELVEIWQCNSAGRYIHRDDRHDAPLDPNFLGAGRCVTDEDGCYRFLTIRPGAYPWGNHPNAWRPAHIHFSLFGPTIASRLVTQMYFPGDPLLEFDPIFAAVPEAARDRLVSRFQRCITEEGYALGYNFDIVLAGGGATPFEEGPE